MELSEIVRLLVRSEIEYMEKDIERLERQLRSLAKSVGKTIPYEATWVIEDAKAEKDE